MSRIAVFGLGYVGAVTSACLARDGHRVVGVDVNPAKVQAILEGRAPVIEEGLDDVISAGVESGRLSATTDAAAGLDGADLALVCVGTPSSPNGDIDLTYVRAVVDEIARHVAETADPVTIVVRSTVVPGSTEDVLVPIVEKAIGGPVGERVNICFHPEFLREGSSLEDFDNPPKIVVGSDSDIARKSVLDLYASIDAPIVECDATTAEMVKYVDNTWHAVKVAFANEMGRIAKAVGIDGRTVMDVFALDTKLNISPKYLKPGMPFGGSCLPKDVRALRYLARRRDLDLPLTESVLPSNERHVDACVDLILAQGTRNIGLLGLSFKDGTDDLRESPMVEIAERLIGKGCNVRIYDPEVRLASLVGANRHFIEERIPHLSRLLTDDVADVIAADLVVLGRRGVLPEHIDVESVVAIDLTGMLPLDEGWHGLVY